MVWMTTVHVLRFRIKHQKSSEIIKDHCLYEGLYISHPCYFFRNLHILSLQGMQNISGFDTNSILINVFAFIHVQLTCTSTDEKYEEFLNIPFSAPVGRWQLPTQPEPWQGIRDATGTILYHSCVASFLDRTRYACSISSWNSISWWKLSGLI